MSPIRSLFGFAFALMAAVPVLADDQACLKAARDHASFKAILNDDKQGEPQYDTVKRESDDIVRIDRFVGSEHRLTLRMLYGLFLKEQEITVAGRSIRMATSRSIDPKTLMPLRPNTSRQYKMFTVQGDALDPSKTMISDVTLTIGSEREVAIGTCRLRVIDVTTDGHAVGRDLVSTTRMAYSPDLAYPVETEVEFKNNGKATTLLVKVQAIEPWQGVADPPAKPN